MCVLCLLQVLGWGELRCHYINREHQARSHHPSPSSVCSFLLCYLILFYPDNTHLMHFIHHWLRLHTSLKLLLIFTSINLSLLLLSSVCISLLWCGPRAGRNKLEARHLHLSSTQLRTFKRHKTHTIHRTKAAVTTETDVIGRCANFLH